MLFQLLVSSSRHTRPLTYRHLLYNHQRNKAFTASRDKGKYTHGLDHETDPSKQISRMTAELLPGDDDYESRETDSTLELIEQLQQTGEDTFGRCVIQPNQWESCQLSEEGELCEWRAYVVCGAGRYRMVDKCRLSVSSPDAKHGFFKQPSGGMVPVPDGECIHWLSECRLRA